MTTAARRNSETKRVLLTLDEVMNIAGDELLVTMLSSSEINGSPALSMTLLSVVDPCRSSQIL